MYYVQILNIKINSTNLIKFLYKKNKNELASSILKHMHKLENKEGSIHEYKN